MDENIEDVVELLSKLKDYCTDRRFEVFKMLMNISKETLSAKILEELDYSLLKIADKLENKIEEIEYNGYEDYNYEENDEEEDY